MKIFWNKMRKFHSAIRNQAKWKITNEARRNISVDGKQTQFLAAKFARIQTEAQGGQGAGCMLRWRPRGNRGHPNSVSRATKGRPKNNIKIWRLREESGVGGGLKWKKEIWREETPRGKMPDTFMRKLKFIPAFSPESISNSERVGNYYFPRFFLLSSFSNQSSLSPSPHLFVADSRARHIHTAHSTACTSTKFLYINLPPHPTRLSAALYALESQNTRRRASRRNILHLHVIAIPFQKWHRNGCNKKLGECEDLQYLFTLRAVFDFSHRNFLFHPSHSLSCL